MSRADEQLLLRLQFRELGLRFLDSYNPKLDKSIVVADAILSYDGPIETHRPVRHLAHEFVQECVGIIEGKSIRSHNENLHHWITVWNREFGV
jgi:hypothetical protein